MNQETFKNTVFVLKDKMYRFAKSILIDEDDAYDLVQEVMMKLWQKKDELSAVTNIEAFAIRCIRNDAVTKLRRAKIAQLYQDNLTEEIATEKYPELTKELVVRLIGALPEKQKMVMHLRDIEEYEIREISETIDMPENAVRTNLMRARHKVREQLGKIFDYETSMMAKYGQK